MAAILATGDANHVLSDGTIDPGKSLGFGKPNFNYGLTATRQFSDDATAVFEFSQVFFQEYQYDAAQASPVQTMKFGTETRLNAALSYRLMTRPESRFRLDGNLEANFLRLGKDVADGVPDEASGGDILYAVVGVRLYQDAMSLACPEEAGVERPQRAARQPAAGREGTEEYRFVATFSALF